MSQFTLLRSRRFLPLFLTQFLGAFNDNFLKNALVILITYKTTTLFGIPAEQMVAAAGGIFILPFFLFSAQSGQLADKYEKGRLIGFIKLAEIGIMMVAAVGFFTHHYALLFVSLFLMGVHSTVFGPIKYSILPQHLSEQEIVGGNALVEAGTFLAILLGTIAGGLLIAVEPYGPQIVSAGLVLVAIAGWLTGLKIPQAPPVDPTLKFDWNPIRPTWRILRQTKQNKAVYLSILGVSWFWFFGGAMLSLFPPYCKLVLHAEEKVVTLFLALFSVGIALGSLLCERMSRRQLELGLVPIGSIGISLFSVDLFLVGAPNFVVGQAEGAVTLLQFLSQPQGIRIVFDLIGLATFSGFYIVPLYTLIQTRSEVTHRSRVIAGNNILNALFMVAAALMLVFMLKRGLSVPQMFLVLALMNAAVASYIYFLLPEFCLRFVAWSIANVLYRLRIVHAEKIPLAGAAVLVCNHVSFVDWLLLGAAIQRPARFIMDHHFAKGAIMKALVRQAKIIPIAPAKENPEILQAAFEKAAEELRDGQLVCIFPEGRITSDGKMGPFKAGIERIISETPVPVIPLAIHNMWGSLFSRKDGKAFQKRPRRFWSRIEVRVGDAIPASEVTAALLEEKVAGLLNR